MLDLSRLQSQFSDFGSYQVQEEAIREQRLRRAIQALRECRTAWEDLNDRARAANPKWLVGRAQESPDTTCPCGPRPTPITVVATDGSQIFPDRNIEPTCYLLNIGRIAFQYGTHERPLMESAPFFRYRSVDLEDHFDDVFETSTAEIVSALRDGLELEALLDVAESVRIAGRPIVAMADGTLIRWMVRRMHNRALEERLIARYTETLAGFRNQGIPVCSYISMPNGTEVVNLLRVFLGDTDDAGEESIKGLVDRKIFECTLGIGERSAIFESSSHIQQDYGEDRICFFYVHVASERGGAEIGRVEIPLWVAGDASLVDMVHAVILSECEKGDGYPVILSEAHQQAVVRARERDIFYEMVDGAVTRVGLAAFGSRKAASKRTPRV